MGNVVEYVQDRIVFTWHRRWNTTSHSDIVVVIGAKMTKPTRVITLINTLFLAITMNVAQENGSWSLTKVSLSPNLGCWWIAQLSADNISLFNVPIIAADGAPSAFVKDLDSAYVEIVSTNKTYGNCKKLTKCKLFMSSLSPQTSANLFNWLFMSTVITHRALKW